MELNVDEALRYLGIGGQAAESIRASVAAVADKLTAAIQPRYTYRMCSLQKTEAGFLLPEAELVLPGADAAKMLEQCDQAVLMACTLGTQFEALLRREQARDMSRAVILAACGSAWVEAGCDQVGKNWRVVFRTAIERTGSVPGTEICRCLCSRRSAPHWIPKGGLDCM